MKVLVDLCVVPLGVGVSVSSYSWPGFFKCKAAGRSDSNQQDLFGKLFYQLGVV